MLGFKPQMLVAIMLGFKPQMLVSIFLGIPTVHGWHDQLHQGSSGKVNYQHGVITGCDAFPLAA